MIVRLCLVFALAAIRQVAADSCGQSITISGQSDADKISNCEDVKGSVTIAHDASGTIKLDNVQAIHGKFTIDGTSVSKVQASNLDLVKEDFSVQNNGKLSELAMSNLEKVGGSMWIEGNNQLQQLQFNNLETVKGDISFKGQFDSISLSNLEKVTGKGTIRSSGSLACSGLDHLASSTVFGGSYRCSKGSSTSTSSTPSSSSSSSSSSSGSSGLSEGGKAGVAVGVIVGVGLIAGAIWFLVWRRKKGASFQSVPAPDAADSEKGGAALPTNGPSPTESPGMAAGNISRKPVSPPPQEQERDIPMLDSGDVHEAPAMLAGGERDTTQVFELDAGPIYGMHQQAIHHE